MDPPNDIKNYELKEGKVKYFRPIYNLKTGEFLGIYETISFFVVRGDPFEVFLNYGFDPEKSKILYSSFRKKVYSSFCGTMFNRYKQIIDSGKVDQKMSKMYFYLPSITDRSEEVNQYLKNVNISSFDLSQKQLNVWSGGVDFIPSKLEIKDLETPKIRQGVVKVLEHIASVSNTKLVRNADSFLCRKSSASEVQWLDGAKRMMPEKYKISYYMDALPNEIILYILMYLLYYDILCLSYVSKKFYCLCNNRPDFKELCINVWSLYRDKKDFNSAIKKCRIDIHDNIVNSFEIIKTRHYLKGLLMKKLEASFENLNTVQVLIHLINCNCRIRSVQKCML